MRKILYWLFVAVVIFFTCVMVKMVMPYIPFKGYTDFLATKSNKALSKSFYLPSFYIHITTSFIALVIGVFQFIPKFIITYPKLHKRLGMAYVYSILLLACPSGFVLAINANGGIAAQVGFTMQCVLWFMSTLFAVYNATQKKWLSHIHSMIVSYAITLAAFSLRTESYFMHTVLETKLNETYVTVTWLSWVGNLLIALLLVQLGVGERLLKRLKR
jgi:uncharacterized membrane protein